MHVNVCGGSLSQTTQMGGKTLLLGPGWKRGDYKFSVLFRGETENF